MPRIVKLHATGPVKIDPSTLSAEKPLSLCACGLSKKFPLCDGAHKVTRAEQPGLVYRYAADGSTIVEVRHDTDATSAPPAVQGTV